MDPANLPNFQFIFEPEMAILKGYIKMGIISSSTLEGSDSLNSDIWMAKYLNGKKRETRPKKPPSQPTHTGRIA